MMILQVFCSKIGIVFNDISKARLFLDQVKVQQKLPRINLDHRNDCVEQLHALHF